MNKTAQNSRFSIGKKVASAFLSAAMLVTSFTGIGGLLTTSTTVDAADSGYGLMDNCQEGVILHAWEWSFNNIKNNMKKIAEAGYTSVQTSVIQQAKEGTKGKGNNVWWLYYQPANFTIDNTGNSALGTKAEFAAMCEEAHKYGIHVIVDVVANHLGNNTGYDKASSIPSDIRDDQNCWHDQWNKEINYDSRYSITHGSMGGLPDLNTENPKIQNYVKNYLKECIDCGADGFRFDAAKHIGVPNDTENAGGDFWPNVLNEAYSYYKTKGTYSSGLYCYGEILDGTGGPAISQYTQYMSVTDNKTGNEIRGSVAGNNASGAASSYYKLGAGANKTVLWAESHDTYSNDGKESTGVSDSDINKTWALVGSRNNATALYFARTGGWRNGNIGDILSTQCFNKEVVEVNKFHNYFNGQSEYIASSGSIAYNERGTSGVVLVNCSGGSTSVSIKANKMAAGEYVDQVTGNKFTVSNGQISGQIGNTGIAVVYNATPITKSAIVSASPDSSAFTTSTLSVKLGVKNASSGSYTTSEGQSGTYTDGQSITIGSSTSVGGSITVTLSATGEDGVKKTGTYTYVKKDPSQVTSIYFDNSSYKWSNVYAYVYDDSSSSGSDVTSNKIHFMDTANWGTAYAYFFTGSTKVGADWPGTQMTKGSSDYSVDIPSGATMVVFNNGNNGKKTADLALSGVYGYKADGSTYSANGASTVTENAGWPGVKMTLDSSTGYYKYDVPSNLVKGKAIFSDGTNSASSRYPAYGEAGLSINDTSMLFSAGNSWKPYSVTPVPTPDPDKLVSESSVSSTSVEKGMPVVITGVASGGKAPYKYSFSYKKSTDSQYIQLGNVFSSKNTETFYPHLVGTYLVLVEVRDANNTIAKQSIKVKATASTYEFTNDSKINKSSITIGDDFRIYAKRTGGKAPYYYTYLFKRAGNTKWNKIGTEWGTKASATLAPTSAATFDIRVLIKDSSGRVATKSFQATATGSGTVTALTNKSSVKSTTVTAGTKVSITGAASGGTSPYTYAYYYKRSTNTKWNKIGTEFGTATSASFTPASAATFDVKVIVKDSTGKTAEKKFTVKAT